MCRYRPRLLALLLGAVAATAAAQDAPPADAESKARERGTAAAVLDPPHTYLSHNLERLSRRLDAILGDSNRAYDSTGSTLQLRGYINLKEAGRSDGGPEVRAHLSLPNTEDRLKLVVQRGLTAATQTEAERGIKEQTGSDQVAAAGAQQDDDYYLGLKALIGEPLGIKTSVEGGVRITTPVDPYLRLRIVRDFTLESWAIRLSETPLWKDSEGFSTATEASLGRSLAENWLFRFTSKATWRKTTEYFDLAYIASLFYTPDRHTAFTFEVSAFGPSEPSTEPSVYAITLRARRQIYKDWLYFELAPQVLYQQVNGFRAENSVMLRLEALFGDRYLQP